ncbi:IclR family transcriptional regulator [Actinocorallia sp. A-T 12471]|uniref:IclR family transcriptional regulator n=1 Tax=Actinocorallia sp. A-T 12471 TaxID=3089813 RepID=UPI0029D2697D|nr:IclR family transcriptional regulator [Actinocorallia sp. A-T 12471]MDX6744177.1 IclR family transcriptional regulator [Actinocorallia sp. A-T 12471]
MASDERQGIQSVEVAMEVLTALEEARRPVSLSTLANLSGLQPSKVHRYLVSLVRSGLAAQEKTTGLYTLGSAVRRLGIEALRRVDEAGIASQHAIELRDRTQHTVLLVTWSDAGPTLIRWDYGAYPLPISVRVGSVLPLIDSSAGRVCYAYLPQAITKPVLRAQEKRGEARAYTDEELTKIVNDVRSTQVCITAGAIIPGLSVVASPVFGPGDGLALVLGFALPSRELTAPVTRRLSDDLLKASRLITADLGGQVKDPPAEAGQA